MWHWKRKVMGSPILSCLATMCAVVGERLLLHHMAARLPLAASGKPGGLLMALLMLVLAI